jgi:hypothetical protein
VSFQKFAVLAVATLVFVAIGTALVAAVYHRHHDAVETDKAQACVDTGGFPWHQACLYRGAQP